jgi:DNA-binding GntR family transcriptional regulator
MARPSSYRVSASVTADEVRADRVYELVLDWIMAGKYQQGSRLRERELSELYDVSRVPVREALQRLEQDGFVEMFPRRGAVVRTLTLTDVNELFDVRLCLEPFAARMAATRVAASQPVGRLQALLDEIRDAVVGARSADVVRLGAECHAEIVRLSGNRLLNESLKPLFGRMRWIFGLAHNFRDETHSDDHTELCNAVLAGRSDLAYSLAYSHIELCREPALAGLAHTLDP